jgi:transmembrane sensor
MLRREAASWLARLQSAREPDVERKFERWRGTDPRHAQAFDRVRRSYEQAGLLRQSSAPVSDHPKPAVRKAEWTPMAAIAAAAAIVILVPLGFAILRDGKPFVGTEAVMLMTRVGEIKQVELADGSRVTLDTATRMDVEIGRSRRSAHLRYGRARLQIAGAKVPFVVETPSATITARRGTIDVEQGARQDRVEVLEGGADVRGSDKGQAATVTLARGEAVAVSSSGAGRKGAVPPAADWTKGMLQFDQTPLRTAVALANRYSGRHILLAGDVDALRVTGAFRAGDTVGLAKALAAAFGLSLKQDPEGDLVLSRSRSGRLQNKRGG